MRGRSNTARGRNEQRTCVLLVDAMEKDREVMGRFLSSWKFEPVEASNAREALEIASRQAVSIALISDPGRGTAGMELVRELRQARPGLETILLAADPSATYATEAFRAGAYDCLTRPVDFKQLSRDLSTLREAVRRKLESKAWEAAAGADLGLAGMAGISAPMQAVFASLRRFAMEESPVLITGLTGTGKELAARVLHSLSRRASQPLVVYRCCGVSESVAAMELFGEPARSCDQIDLTEPPLGEVGKGLMDLARGGTLLLDEIGELPPAIQTRLANVLQQGRLVGSPDGSQQDGSVRLLAATRLNMAEQAGQGEFSAELYRLLGSNLIHLPSLVERTEDIPLLCGQFLEKSNREFDKATRAFSPAAKRALLSYHWPGNVRELENVIARACLLAEQDWIELSDLSIAASSGAGESPERYSEWAGESRFVARESEPRKAGRRLRSPAQTRTGPPARDGSASNGNHS
ncbi:MAG: sigma-54-dependent Fis family transcriptional regulator [Acidobacteria bacterium]|nr:sigma-54-dependent Fis family transcriptional regulator [Acidobacteriota bacterium]